MNREPIPWELIDDDSDTETEPEIYSSDSSSEISDESESVSTKNLQDSLNQQSTTLKPTQATSTEGTNSSSTATLTAHQSRYYILRDLVGYSREKIEAALKAAGIKEGSFDLCKLRSTKGDEIMKNEEAMQLIQQRQSDVDQKIKNESIDNLRARNLANAAGQCSSLQSDILRPIYIGDGNGNAGNCGNSNTQKPSASGSSPEENQNSSKLPGDGGVNLKSK